MLMVLTPWQHKQGVTYSRDRLPHVPVAADMVPIPVVVAVMARDPAAVAEVPGPAAVAVRGDNNADRLPGSDIYIHALTININKDF